MASSVAFSAMSSLISEHLENMRLIISFRLIYIIFLRVGHVGGCAYGTPRNNFEVEEKQGRVTGVLV